MADNPFYPGYEPTPKDAAPNPVYPGYYPGQTLPRRPIPRKFLTPIEYNFDELLAALDMIDYEVRGLPEVIKKQIIDDFKQQLKVSVRPLDITADKLDDYDSSSLPGAFGIAVSLNPKDWTKDPQKQLKKTLNNWAKSVVNHEDFELRVRTNLWNEVIGTDDFSTSKSRPVGVREVAETMMERTLAQHGQGVGGSGAGKNPLVLKGLGVMKEDKGDHDWVSGKRVKKDTDVYANMGFAVIDFEKYLENPGKRDGQYSFFLRNANTAIATELEQKKALLDPKYHGRVDLFLKKSELIDDISGFNLAISGPFGVMTELKRDVVGNPLANPAPKMESVKRQLFGVVNPTDPTKNELSIIEKLDNHLVDVKALATSGQISEEAYRQLEAQTRDCRNYLLNLQEALKDADKMSSRQILNALDRTSSGKFFGKTLSGGDVVGESILFKLLRETTERDVLGIGENPDSISSVIRDNSDKLYAHRAAVYIRRLSKERTDFSFEELLDNLGKGKLFENYLWPRVVRRLTGYTPGQIAEVALKKVQYFGLLIDDMYLPDTLGRGHIFNNRLFKYKFGVDFSVDGVTNIKVMLDGGRHFGMYAKDGFGFLAALNDMASGTNALAPAAFAYMMAPGFDIRNPAHYAELVARNGGQLVLPFKKDQADAFMLRLESFKNYVYKDFSKFGAKADANNPVFWKNLITALHKENINPDRMYYVSKAYVGLLERLFVSLNALQTKIVKSKVGSFAINSVFNAKNIVVEKIIFYISKGIAFLLSQLGRTLEPTGALSKFLEKFLYPLIRVTVRKAIDLTISFGKFLIQGDVVGFLIEIEKTMAQIVKVLTLAAGIPILIIFVVIFAFFGTSSSSFSPIDPTAANAGFGAGLYPGYPPGENAYVKVTKDVFVNGDQNPEEPIPNEDIYDPGLSYYYEIKVTPKITITGPSLAWVTYTDRVVVRRNDGSSQELFNTGTVTLTEFNNGSTISFRLPEVTDFYIPMDNSFEDTLISNVITLNLPAIAIYNQPPSSVTFSRSFQIGEYIPECLVNTDYRIMTKSYDSSDGVGHGSTDYWENLNAGGTDRCSFGIPYIYKNGNVRSPKRAGADNNICFRLIDDTNLKDDHYGWALDVAPAAPAITTYEVRLPALGDTSRVWQLSGRNDNGDCQPNTGGAWGYGFTATSGEYTIYVTHMDRDTRCSDTIRAGEVVGHLFTGWTAGVNQIHAHIEILVGGVPVKPESLVCKSPF